jgi:hypothetical protein
MEQYTSSISLLLQHGQRFFEIMNFQIIIAVAVLGFVMSNEGRSAKDQVRMNITIVFFLLAVFSVYTESIHHQREMLVWNALEAHVAAAPDQFLPAEVEYIDSLKPTSFWIKAGALAFADALVVAITWISPRLRE